MSATGRNLVGRERRADDFYSTPTWCTKAILPKLRLRGDVLDPCCGTGAIFDALPDIHRVGIEIDHERGMVAAGKCAGVIFTDAFQRAWPTFGTLITNPPYILAQEFVEESFRYSDTQDLAFLLRLNFLGSQKRAEFHKRHPADIYVLPRRPSFTEDGKTDATEYAWYVWGPGRGNRWEILDA